MSDWGATNERDLTKVLIGLGSNLGDREKNIEEALAWISAHPRMKLKRYTKSAETEPWGVVDQPLFLNAVAEVFTTLGPSELLGELKLAEKALGRTQGAAKWGPREIDMDILLFGDLVMETWELTIPHAHLASRSFILEQILELEPDGFHPRTGVSFGKLAAGGDGVQ